MKLCIMVCIIAISGYGDKKKPKSLRLSDNISNYHFVNEGAKLSKCQFRACFLALFEARFSVVFTE